MPRIIKNTQIVEDHWQVLTLAEGETPEAVALPAAPTLLPLAVWLARRNEIVAAGLAPGVWLDAGEGPEALADDLDRLAVIGVNFPKFTDGRSYSSARLLRERYAYRGEIRALGDVQQDQLFFMRRCGIDAYALRADKDIDKALAGLAVFSDAYQAAVDQPQPLFRRRTARGQEAA
ncbi:MAG: DUF934 domain-containing protein [Candidatus Accumulibacter phosphatis]|jgi:uncharacterized protein (DUF934 family)|uniref:DUF934 domain-containing protein n=1 Tax=Candidatus Accumulibacter phosphatis TaxID=327160 RepID=A0ABX1TXZ7_9PROT|nr:MULTISPECIES: DUF934 domain-containing protein [Candidatus Accumulibacter]NMQ27595.1 DUF934 domain-containing protein [Candidatus Accumulibacter phosphatis]